MLDREWIIGLVTVIAASCAGKSESMDHPVAIGATCVDGEAPAVEPSDPKVVLCRSYPRRDDGRPEPQVIVYGDGLVIKHNYLGEHGYRQWWLLPGKIETFVASLKIDELARIHTWPNGCKSSITISGLKIFDTADWLETYPEYLMPTSRYWYERDLAAIREALPPVLLEAFQKLLRLEARDAEPWQPELWRTGRPYSFPKERA